MNVATDLSETQKLEWKAKFEDLFPHFKEKFEKVKCQEDVLSVQEEFINHFRSKLKTEIQAHQSRTLLTSAKSNNDVDQTIPVSLAPKQYEKLINARGNEIHTQIQLILDGLDRVSKMGETASPEAVTAQIIGFGSLAIGAVAGAVTFSTLAGATIVTEGVTISASLAGVVAAGVGAVVAGAALVLGLVLIPFIYFMVKPAICITFLINELDKDLEFIEDYNVHGKPTLLTQEIGKALKFPDGDIYTNGGLYSTSKRDAALFGAQYGFSVRYDENTTIAFGSECPLNGNNNCYCEVNASAKKAAEQTTKKDKLYFEDEKNGIKASIRCNSDSGSVAWYIARVYNV